MEIDFSKFVLDELQGGVAEIISRSSQFEAETFAVGELGKT